MLHWRGGGRTVQERAAIHEHDGGLERDEAERLAWQHVERKWAGILSSASTKSRGATEHWRPPPREMYER